MSFAVSSITIQEIHRGRAVHFRQDAIVLDDDFKRKPHVRPCQPYAGIPLAPVEYDRPRVGSGSVKTADLYFITRTPNVQIDAVVHAAITAGIDPGFYAQLSSQRRHGP
jgi:hypothetical protein